MSSLCCSIRRHTLACWLLWTLAGVSGIHLARAEEPTDKTREEPRVVNQHTRAFKISIDGTERGTLTMLLRKHEDGIETMRGQAELSFNFVVYKYRYSARTGGRGQRRIAAHSGRRLGHVVLERT